MTVTTTTNNANFSGNDVVTVLPFTFRFFTDQDLVVTLIDDVTGAEIVLDLVTDYTVTGAGTATGGSVVLVVALPTGKTVNVARVLSPVQLTELINQGKFFPEIHENAFDYMTMLIQQTNSSNDRAMIFPITDDPGISRTLPNAEARAQKVLGFDVDGAPVVSSLTLAQIEAQVPLAEAAADAAAASALAASASEGAAASSASAASASELRAQEWAENPEDVPVVPGMFSALHWALKAAQSLVGLAARVLALENIGKPFTKEYVSAEQVITSGGTINLTHGLGAKPKLVEAVLICKTAEQGYSVGEEISGHNDATTSGYNFGVGRSPTTLRCICGSSGIAAFNTSGGYVTLTNANWRLVVRAWA